MTSYTFPLDGPLRLRAGIRSSDLIVTAADTTEATVALEPHRDNSAGRSFAEETLVELKGDILDIEVPRRTGLVLPSSPRLRIHVQLPTGSDLKVLSGSGDLFVNGRVETVEVRIGSGDVRLQEAGAVHVTSGSGHVIADSVTEGRFTSGSGDVRLGRASGSIEAKSGSGDLIIDSAVDVVAAGASGDTRIDVLAGRARIRSASGDLEVGRAVHGTINASSASGDVTIGVPTGTAVLMDCSSTSGRTTSSLSPAQSPEEEEQVLKVEARSVSGDIHIARSH